MIVSLTGFMGCGKSSIGKVLSQLLGCPLTDTDSWIEQHDGRTVKEIFAEEGETGFRKMEVNALRQLLHGHEDAVRNKGIDMIISLGGGTVTTPEAAELVREKTFCIYLRAGTETLVENLTRYPGERPMLGHPESREALEKRIVELVSRRSAIYESTSSMIFDIDGKDYMKIAEELRDALVR